MRSEKALPKNWQFVRVKDIAETYSGGTPSRRESNFFGGSIPWVKSGELNSGKITVTEESLTEAGLSESSAKWVPKGSVLAAMYGATAGKFAWLAIDATINQAILAIRGYGNKACNRFLFYCLSEATQKLLSNLQGSGQPNLNSELIRELEIALPPLNEQRTIADVLGAVDDAIEATQAVIEQTRRLKTALLQDLLTNSLPGRHKKFKETKSLGRIPVDWDVVHLDEIATVERGKFTHRPRNDPRFYGGNIPFVQTGDIVASGDYLRKHSQTLNEHGLSVSRMFPKGTILFAIAASVGATTIASYDVAFPDSIVGITPNAGIQSLFLLRVLQAAKNRIIRTATESAQANISLELLRPLPFALPSEDEQEAIAEALRAVEERLEQTRAQLGQLIQVKTALSQGLLTGRIPVSTTDEEVA